MINKIKLYTGMIGGLLIAIFLYGRQKKKEGRKDERARAIQSEVMQRRKNANLRNKVNKMSREELENAVVKK